MLDIHYPKEQMHRIAYTKLTERQIGDKLRAAANGPASASPLSGVYAGKSCYEGRCDLPFRQGGCGGMTGPIVEE